LLFTSKMILDFRKDGLYLLVSTPPDVTVGRAAVLLQRFYDAWKRDANILIDDTPMAFSDLQGKFDSEGELGVTLWWAKKPLAESLLLGDKFGNNERTKVSVTTGPLDPHATVTIAPAKMLPVAPLKATRSAHETLKERAKALRSERVGESALKRLKIIKDEFSLPLQTAIIEIISSADPAGALVATLNSNRELRSLADAILTVVKVDESAYPHVYDANSASGRTA
jgi:hypothetical protein